MGVAPMYMTKMPKSDALAVLQAIRDNRVTNLTGSPSAYKLLREALVSNRSAFPKHTWSHVRCASSAGEALLPSLQDFWTEEFGSKLRSHYGSTEHGMLINDHHRNAVDFGKPHAIGRVMDGYKVRIGVDGKSLEVDKAQSELYWL
jgi:acetyl-CoA synthetase